MRLLESRFLYVVYIRFVIGCLCGADFDSDENRHCRGQFQPGDGDPYGGRAVEQLFDDLRII